MSDSPILCTIDLEAPGKAGRQAPGAALVELERMVEPVRPDRHRRERRRPDGDRSRRRSRRRARGAGGCAQPRARPAAGAGQRPRDRDPVRLDGRLARLHATLAVGREHEPLLPRLADGPADEQLAHFLSTELFPRSDIVVDMHSGGRTGLCLPWSEMHWVDDVEQRRQMVDGMLALELRLVLCLHRHRRHRPARRRGRAAGQDRRQHRARRRRSRHRRDPPPRARAASRTSSAASA